jgi:hypothetical protein
MPAPNFYSYHEMKAKFDSKSTSCGGPEGHDIKKGDVIGYCRKGAAFVHCADCWAKWKAENAEADAAEAFQMRERNYY